MPTKKDIVDEDLESCGHIDRGCPSKVLPFLS
jgi:hypothetical protein